METDWKKNSKYKYCIICYPDNYNEICVFIDIPTEVSYYTFSNRFIYSQYNQNELQVYTIGGFNNGYKNTAFVQLNNKTVYGFAATFNNIDYTHHIGASVHVFGR